MGAIKGRVLQNRFAESVGGATCRRTRVVADHGSRSKGRRDLQCKQLLRQITVKSYYDSVDGACARPPKRSVALFINFASGRVVSKDGVSATSHPNCARMYGVDGEGCRHKGYRQRERSTSRLKDREKAFTNLDRTL
ncbi:hypothetical protein EVAR_873_1 [Eumeta japonica]|uniref:Uncharacterized protein n=1 Tax=Eumeta variegata TaxID=151549 RepID=A0A4C1SDT3_EUMVA|nr:hypothetical protein EVAR_873_1 [Eumeta japonica]